MRCFAKESADTLDSVVLDRPFDVDQTPTFQNSREHEIHVAIHVNTAHVDVPEEADERTRHEHA